MASSQGKLVSWTLNKAEQYLESADDNLRKDRLFPAAEEIFRVVETTLEALLYNFGVKKITYPGKKKEFTGRLALQLLVRDHLLRTKRIEEETYKKYLELATDLHLAGYQKVTMFDKKKLKQGIVFAEDLLIKAKSMAKK